MDFVNNGEVSGVTLLNSKFFHMNMYQCKDMLIKDVTVTAPGDSPNTDGIHMGDTSGITITNTVIGVGDDCISISLLCTAKIQCTGVTMDDVNVEYSGTNNKTMDICTNTKGCTKGCLKELACF
ncbi:Pectin lyase-like superfamily protein [Zea mays]|uniref:Pectin lyase-like superfamily protein n=1 Tax=Zea mays TaxID=4577 RepID=A0A1D6LRF0_MAIZE|nr:Pectin lyase-like superfamily protein [Zea mays]